MKKILLAGVISALALPVIAAETTTITTSSPEAMTTTTTTTQSIEPQIQKEEEMVMEKEEAAPAVNEPSTAPAVDALPETGGGFRQPLDQQRMEDPASSPQPQGAPHRLDDPTIEDESGEYAPKIDDVDDMEDYD